MVAYRMNIVGQVLKWSAKLLGFIRRGWYKVTSRIMLPQRNVKTPTFSIKIKMDPEL